jgi:hypothetical protein
METSAFHGLVPHVRRSVRVLVIAMVVLPAWVGASAAQTQPRQSAAEPAEPAATSTRTDTTPRVDSTQHAGDGRAGKAAARQTHAPV